MPISYEAKLSYLAGIIDGEGCIHLHTKKESGYHQCKISITNTDEGILNNCRNILNEIDVLFCETYSNGVNYKVTIIEVCRANECKYLLEIIFPYLNSIRKREKAIKFLEFLNSDDNRFDKIGRKSIARSRIKRINNKKQELLFKEI